MLLTEDPGDGDYHIKSYTDNSIEINDTVYRQSLVISMHQLIEKWTDKAPDALDNRDFEAIVQLKPDVVLIGTGRQFKILDPQQLSLFYQHRIGVSCMDTGAACRTYIALAAEGRQVVAALILEPEELSS